MAAFGFLGSNPGAITVQGSQLSVTPGQSISLVGGNITVQSGTPDEALFNRQDSLRRAGRSIWRASLHQAKFFLQPCTQAPNINGQSFGTSRTIQITGTIAFRCLRQWGRDRADSRRSVSYLDNSTISANVTGPGPIVNGVEAIGGGIDIQVSQDAVIQNAGGSSKQMSW